MHFVHHEAQHTCVTATNSFHRQRPDACLDLNASLNEPLLPLPCVPLILVQLNPVVATPWKIGLMAGRRPNLRVVQ